MKKKVLITVAVLALVAVISGVAMGTVLSLKGKTKPDISTDAPLEDAPLETGLYPFEKDGKTYLGEDIYYSTFDESHLLITDGYGMYQDNCIEVSFIDEATQEDIDEFIASYNATISGKTLAWYFLLLPDSYDYEGLLNLKEEVNQNPIVKVAYLKELGVPYDITSDSRTNG